MPSKSLLEFARRNPHADFDEAFAWLRRVRREIAAHDSVERYRQSGVDVFLGPARFVDRNSVEVGGRRLTARRFLIASGARAEYLRRLADQHARTRLTPRSRGLLKTWFRYAVR